jgi:hypothetical protein
MGIEAAVSDLERERAIRALRERYGRGELSLEQFSARLDDAFAARSPTELAHAAGEEAELIPARPESSLGAYESLRRQLATGERVVWIGQPDPRQLSAATKRLMIPIGAVVAIPLLLLMLPALRLATMSHARTPFPDPLFALIFAFVAIAAAVFAALVPVALRAKTAESRRRTLYALTDRRVLRVVRHRHGEDVTALELSAIPAVSMRTRADGGGTIAFGSGGAMPQAAAVQALELYGRAGIGPMAFVGIPDAAKVADLVRDLRERRRAA